MINCWSPLSNWVWNRISHFPFIYCNIPAAHAYETSQLILLGTDHLTCRGCYGFLFRSEFFFRTIWELEYLLPKYTIRLGTDHLTWRGGGYGFLFRSEFFFRTTQELEYYFFFCRANCKFFFQNLTLGYMTKTLNQIIFFSSTKIRIFF